MTSLVSSCYVNRICDFFGCRHVAAIRISVCWMWLPLTVPPRCRQMVDPAPSLPDDFHPHYGSAMFTQNSQAQQRHQEPASAAFSLFHPKNRERSKATEVERAFLLTGGASPPRKTGGIHGRLAQQCGPDMRLDSETGPRKLHLQPPRCSSITSFFRHRNLECLAEEAGP